jgi:hypothetical protein
MTNIDVHRVLVHSGFHIYYDGFHLEHFMPNGKSNYSTYVGVKDFGEFMDLPLELMPKYLEPCTPSILPYVLVVDGKGFTYVAPAIAKARLELGV